MTWLNSGKTQSLVSQPCGPFRDKFDCIVLICPTFAHNKTYYRFAEKDPRFFVVICKQNQVEKWLTVQKHHLFEGTNTLFFLDHCTTSKTSKGALAGQSRLQRQAQRHQCGWWTSRSPASRNLSTNTPKAIFEEYAGKLTKEEYKALISKLKRVFFVVLEQVRSWETSQIYHATVFCIALFGLID